MKNGEKKDGAPNPMLIKEFIRIDEEKIRRNEEKIEQLQRENCDLKRVIEVRQSTLIPKK